jgi:molecular chaperone GrpE
MIDEENQQSSVPPSAIDEFHSKVEETEIEVDAVTVADPGSEATIEGSEQPLITVESETTEADNADYAAAYQTALAERDREIQALKAQVEDRTNQYVRIAADFDNYRKRTQREKEELEQQIKCSTINELLPVVDNFERARAQIKPQTDAESIIHKSYQSVYKQLVDCLKRIGVSPMRSEGKEFDPNLHEAVMRQSTDEFAEGIVMEELQRGYLLGERVLRHALVKVAAAPEPVIPSEENAEGGQEG